VDCGTGEIHRFRPLRSGPRAEKFPELAQTSEWLAREYGGEMKYLAASATDLQSVLPGVRSVIVCLLNYNTAHPLSTETKPQNDERGAPRVDFPIRLGT